MKLFKLIKSMDYVTYPSYKELVKISDAVTNSMSNFRDIIISAIIGLLFETSPLSGYILAPFKEKFPNLPVWNDVVAYKNLSLFLSILIAVLVFFIIKCASEIYIRIESNKSTKRKRDILVYEFYNVAIPQLIEVKSILEQMKEDDSEEERKKVLFLLQAKYEVCELYRFLCDMKVVERDKTGMQTNDSSTLYNRISKCAYITFLSEMLDIMFEIVNGLCNSCPKTAQQDISEIYSFLNSTGIFDNVAEIKEQLSEIKTKLQPLYNKIGE